MTEKRFTDIEHDYENARIRCKDNGMFMLYAIYENDDGLPTLGDLLNEQDSQIKKSNQEILACHDTLVTIIELCDAVLNHDFKNIENKIDFCKMLNKMDNKDLLFFKECFEAIRNNDLKRMTSLTLECNNGDDV